ncbi:MULTISPECIES: hypothetical protein [Xenorhabdus]|uniref:hypothetical protein n=1 Tax=Xenorhabdus TaxID=626 RepID=UPI00069B759B|nr:MULTISPECIES: hypothetical protein [Xenorhabdus]WFQ78468.1 hypothetical protein PXH59_12105 [Xenorhabdus sp. SF857]
MKGRRLCVVHDDSFYKKLGGNNIAKNSFYNVVCFFKYYNFDVCDMNNYMSKGNILSDIDIFLTTNEFSQNNLE